MIPNGIQISTWIAARTERIRLGTMFNVVPQWNPLRLAEDFADAAQPVGRSRRSSVSAAARCRARCCTSTTRACRSDPTTTPTSRPTTSSTARCSRSRWRSSAARSTNESFSFQGKHFHIPVPGIPDRGSTVQALTLIPRPAVPVRDLAGGHQPADARLRAGRRPRRRVLEPALLVHQALLGHVRRALRRSARRRAGAAREADARRRGAHRGHATRRPARRRCPVTTSSGSSSARTGGAGATWARTASRPSRA